MIPRICQTKEKFCRISGTNPEVLEVSGKRDSWTQTENESPRRWPSRRSSSAASTNRPEPLGLLSGPARRTKKNQVTHHVAVEPSVPAFTSYAKLKQSGGLGTVKSLRRKRRPPPNRSSRPDAAQANIPYCPYQKATESCRSHNVCRSVITAGASQQRSLVAPLFKRPQFPPPEIPLEWQGSERSKWDDSAATLLNLTVTFLQKLPKVMNDLLCEICFQSGLLIIQSPSYKSKRSFSFNWTLKI